VLYRRKRILLSADYFSAGYGGGVTWGFRSFVPITPVIFSLRRFYSGERYIASDFFNLYLAAEKNIGTIEQNSAPFISVFAERPNCREMVFFLSLLKTPFYNAASSLTMLLCEFIRTLQGCG